MGMPDKIVRLDIDFQIEVRLFGFPAVVRCIIEKVPVDTAYTLHANCDESFQRIK